MPKIQPYQMQTQAAGAPQVRSLDVGGSGRGFQQFAEGIKELGAGIEKAQDQSDISNLHAKMSQTHADLTVEYHRQLQDGTLDADKFNEYAQTKIDKVGETAKTRVGQNFFTSSAAELKGHFLEQAAMGQSELRGEQAKANYMQALTSSSSALMNDPSTFEFVNKQQQDGIDALVATSGLPATKAAELKVHSQSELAKSSVRGWIQLNPDEAKKQLGSGQWDNYVDGDAKKQLFGEADQAIRAKEVENERLKKAQREALEQEQKGTQNDFLQKMESGQLKSKDILNSNLDAFGSGSKEQFLQLMKRHNEEKIKTDSGTYINIWDKIHLPDGDPQKIVDENDLNKYLGRGLTLTDINAFRAEMQGKKTIQGQEENDLKKGVIDIARGKLTRSNPLTGFKDPIGDENFQRWHAQFLSDFGEQKQKGKNAKELLNPSSPEYLGKNIDSYIRSNQQIIQDLVKTNKRPSAPAPGAPPVASEPRKAGESAADYLKRTGK